MLAPGFLLPVDLEVLRGVLGGDVGLGGELLPSCGFALPSSDCSGDGFLLPGSDCSSSPVSEHSARCGEELREDVGFQLPGEESPDGDAVVEDRLGDVESGWAAGLNCGSWISRMNQPRAQAQVLIGNAYNQFKRLHPSTLTNLANSVLPNTKTNPNSTIVCRLVAFFLGASTFRAKTVVDRLCARR